MRPSRLMVPISIGLLLLAQSGCSADSSPDSSDGASNSACTPQIADSDLFSPGTLTMSTNATLPPMQYVDGSGNVTGMRIELGNEIAKQLCLTPEFVNVEFDAQIPGVQGGRWDMINTGMFYTPARAETITLVPYEVQRVAISVPGGNPDKIAGKDDLAGKTIAVEAPGYEFDTLNKLNEELEAAGNEPINILTFRTNADAYQALSSQQAQGVAIVESVTTYYQDSGNFETAVSGLNEAPLALGFGNPAVAEPVAEALNTLRDNGYLAQLFDQYGVTAYDGPIEISTGELSAS